MQATSAACSSLLSTCPQRSASSGRRDPSDVELLDRGNAAQALEDFAVHIERLASAAGGPSVSTGANVSIEETAGMDSGPCNPWLTIDWACHTCQHSTKLAKRFMLSPKRDLLVHAVEQGTLGRQSP